MSATPPPDHAFVTRAAGKWPLHIHENLESAIFDVATDPLNIKCWRVALTIEAEMRFVPPGRPRLIAPGEKP